MSFCSLFRNYRSKAKISLQDISDFLFESGINLDPAVISKIQNGERKIHDRETFLVILDIFCKKKVLVNIKQAQEFTEISGFGNLSTKELERLNFCLEKTDHENIDHVIDDIQQQIKEKSFSQMVDAWQFLGSYLWKTGRWIKMEEIGNEMFTIFNGISSPYEHSSFLSQMSWMHFWKGNIVLAEKLAKESIQISVDKHQLANAQNKLAKSYQAIGLIEDALTLFNQSLKYYKDIKDDYKYADTLMFIGETYWLAGDTKKAVEHLLKADSQSTILKDRSQRGIILTRLGGIYLQQGDHEKATNTFRLSLTEEESVGIRFGGRFWNNLGLALISHSQSDQYLEEKFFQKAHDEYTHLGMNPSVNLTGTFIRGMGAELQKNKNYLKIFK